MESNEGMGKVQSGVIRLRAHYVFPCASPCNYTPFILSRENETVAQQEGEYSAWDSAWVFFSAF